MNGMNILTGFLVLLTLILGITALIISTNNQAKVRELDEIRKNLEGLTNKNKDLSKKITNTEELKDKVGPRGEKGEAGGLFTQRGPLRSIWAQKKSFGSRFHSKNRSPGLFCKGFHFLQSENRCT